MQVCPYSYFRWCGYFQVFFVTTDEFPKRVTKITSKIGVSWTPSLPFWFLPHFWLNEMAILIVRKPDNFESHNSPKLSFTNNWGLCSDFAGQGSFLELNSPNILALRETNLKDSVDSTNSFMRGYLLLLGKDSFTHIPFSFYLPSSSCTQLLMLFYQHRRGSLNQLIS